MTAGNIYAKKHLALHGPTDGYSFADDNGYDTGMFSDADGDLYFLQNGTKFYPIRGLNNTVNVITNTTTSSPTKIYGGIDINTMQLYDIESIRVGAAAAVYNTAKVDNSVNLVEGYMADSDAFRLHIGGSSDNGWVELATGDNGNEPIYVRQYNIGTGTEDGNQFNTAVHEACLLDKNGNTQFPGDITANGFYGLATMARRTTSLGRAAAISSGSLETGITLTECYMNGYPTDFGNIINITGNANGAGQILCEWISSTGNVDTKPSLHYRNKSDTRDEWSKWWQLAFINDIFNDL